MVPFSYFQGRLHSRGMKRHSSIFEVWTLGGPWLPAAAFTFDKVGSSVTLVTLVARAARTAGRGCQKWAKLQNKPNCKNQINCTNITTCVNFCIKKHKKTNPIFITKIVWTAATCRRFPPTRHVASFQSAVVPAHSKIL